MGDRLLSELVHINSLEQVTTFQLQELAWRTKEVIFVALFQEHASSTGVAEALQRQSKERKLERRREKLEQLDRDGIRKKEESFRSDFMQIVAHELGRLGAPPMMNWQKLVFDKEYCLQAFRLLLTRIKSSRRSQQPSIIRKPATPSTSSSMDDKEEEEEDDSNNKHKRSPVLPLLPRTTTRPSRVRQSQTVTPEWNFDTSVHTEEETEINGRHADEMAEEEERSIGNHSGAGISIQRLAKPRQTSMLAAKLKSNQVQSLQHENERLQEENTTLRNEIQHLQELVRVLQDDQLLVDDAQFDSRRMRFVQAQNTQLQHQVERLQHTLERHADAETNLLSALMHWRELVEKAAQEAQASGADQNVSDKQKGPVKWMFAVPTKMLEELSRLEAQVHEFTKAKNAAMASNLMIGDRSSKYLRSGAHQLSFDTIFHHSLAHVRPDRIKELEAALVDLGKQVHGLHYGVIQSQVPVIECAEDSMGSKIASVLAACRRTISELGAFGVIVPLTSSKKPAGSDATTPLDVLRWFTSSSFQLSSKDRDKQMKTLLKQSQAQHVAMETINISLGREAKFWQTAWQVQEQVMSQCIRQVASVGEAKKQWLTQELMEPLMSICQAHDAYAKAAREATTSTRQNAYTSIVVETLQQSLPSLSSALGRWEAYMATMNDELKTLMQDFQANQTLLAGTLRTKANAQDEPHES